MHGVVHRHAIPEFDEVLAAVYQRPRTTVPHPEHRKWPYLLRGLVIDRPDQVWCADITYIPMRRGFLYLVAIMDWASRRVLSWRLQHHGRGLLGNGRHGRPEIFSTDQDSQFSSPRFTDVLTGADVKVSIDGKRRWMGRVRGLEFSVGILRAWRFRPDQAAWSRTKGSMG